MMTTAYNVLVMATVVYSLAVAYLLGGIIAVLRTLRRRQKQHRDMVALARRTEASAPLDQSIYRVPALWLEYRGVGFFEMIITVLFWPVIISARNDEHES